MHRATRLTDKNTQADEFDSDFEIGDQTMSVKPWLSSIREPTVEPKAINHNAPDESYEIDFVHGYKSDSIRQNLFYNNQGHAVYMTAALGIVLNIGDRKQKYFGGGEEEQTGKRQQSKGKYGHSDDILALAISQDRTKVVTGQLGTEPMIFVWDAETAKRLDFMHLPRGSRSV